jgi:hypothetical protein
MARGTGDPLAGRARGAHTISSLGVRMCRIDFWRRTFISRRRQRRRAVRCGRAMQSGDGSVVGIRLGWGRNGKEDHGTGLEKFGALAAMVRRRASTCFAFMLPKNQVGAVDLFAGTEGTLHGVSNKGVSSLLFRVVARLSLTLSSPVLFSRTHTRQSQRVSPAGACNLDALVKLRSQ